MNRKTIELGQKLFDWLERREEAKLCRKISHFNYKKLCLEERLKSFKQAPKKRE